MRPDLYLQTPNSEVVPSRILKPYNASSLNTKNNTIHIELVGPEILGDFEYEADGVVVRDCSIYFAPRDGQKVLRITTEGNTELIGPTLREETLI